MMNEETYKKEIVRMWDSIRDDEYKGIESCSGVNSCEECALYGIDCGNSTKAFEMIEAVEKWSKEHQPLKLTRFEFEMLKWLDKEGYKFIVRSQSNNLIVYENVPTKLSNCWKLQKGFQIIPLLDGVFQFVQWEDEEPTSIKQVLKKCEVIEDDD